jgi:hypothetical protein
MACVGWTISCKTECALRLPGPTPTPTRAATPTLAARAKTGPSGV